MSVFPYMPGVPAAGHLSGGFWHPGQIDGCPKCPDAPQREEKPVHDDDITSRPHTVNGSDQLTEADVRAYLAADGYAGEAETMITDALRFPDIYRYTDDRHRCIVHTRLRGGEWCWLAADCERGEERIKALGRGRGAGLPLGAFTAEDGRHWH